MVLLNVVTVKRRVPIITKTLTSFKTTSFREVLNFALRQSLVVNPELVHLPLEKSFILVFSYSRMRIPVLRQKTLPSTLRLQSTINEDLSQTGVGVVGSNNVVPDVCRYYWICRKIKGNIYKAALKLLVSK